MNEKSIELTVKEIYKLSKKGINPFGNFPDANFIKFGIDCVNAVKSLDTKQSGEKDIYSSELKETMY